jgi:hypothetical protein
MAEPTLAEVFGAGATQDENTLTIQKSALAAVGLTVSANDKAERLFVAILLVAQDYLTQANFDDNIDQSIVIADSYGSFPVRGDNIYYRSDSKTISLAKIDTESISPNDY